MNQFSTAEQNIIEVAIKLIQIGEATIDNAIEIAIKRNMEHIEKMLQVGKDISAGVPSSFPGAAKYRAEYYKIRKETFNHLQTL